MADLNFQSLDEFTYHPGLRETRGPALVLFSSAGCGTCRRVEALLPMAVEDALLFCVDVQRSPGLAREFEVFHLPALFLYRDGRYHARLDCEVTPGVLRDTLTRALARPAEEEP